MFKETVHLSASDDIKSLINESNHKDENIIITQFKVSDDHFKFVMVNYKVCWYMNSFVLHQYQRKVIWIYLHAIEANEDCDL